jgi:hypothetical protein
MVIITGVCVYLANIMEIRKLFSSSVPDNETQLTLVFHITCTSNTVF